jgi:rfaE bifunctional protein kinase chain/domain
MNYSSLEDIFEAFKNLNILIIGDVMVDSYIWGNVDRISPEAPVPVIQVKKKEKRLGGAANVAKNIIALGAKPILCSVIGDDTEGHYFMNLMQQRQISTEGIVQSTTRITTVKQRFLSGSQHILRVDEEYIEELTREERNMLKERINSLLPDVDAVIFEDYDKGVLNRDLIHYAIDLANQLKKPTIVDPKKKNFISYQNTTLFKPNLKEIREGLKIDLEKNDIQGLKKALETLRLKLKLKNILVTLSDHGVFMSAEGRDYHIPAHIRSISDVSGAGDTVVSIAALCLSLGLSPQFTAALSNLGGGLVCEYLGVVAINKEDLLNEAKSVNLIESIKK